MPVQTRRVLTTTALVLLGTGVVVGGDAAAQFHIHATTLTPLTSDHEEPHP